MKKVCLAGLAMLCCLLFTPAGAQMPPPLQTPALKAPLFAALPERFAASAGVMDRLFEKDISENIKLAVAGNASLEGVVVEKVRHNAHASTINIKLFNYDGALLTLSRIVHDDLSTTYTGRIVNARYRDLYVISAENSQVTFTKRNQSRFMVE